MFYSENQFGAKLIVAQPNVTKNGGTLHFDIDQVEKRSLENKQLMQKRSLDTFRKQKEEEKQQAEQKAMVARLLKECKERRTQCTKLGSKSLSLATQNNRPILGVKAIQEATKQRLKAPVAPTYTDFSQITKASAAFAEKRAEHETDVLHAKLKRLEKAEAVSNSRASVTKIEVKCFFCNDCEKKTEEILLKCKQEDHEISEMKVNKFFFRCVQCKNKTTTLGKKVCRLPCTQCQGIKWEPASAYSDRTLGISAASNQSLQRRVEDGPSTTFNSRSA